MTDTPVLDNASAQAADDASAMAAFDEAAAAAKPANNGAEQPPAKVEPTKAAEPSKVAAVAPADDEFPAELLTGKAEPKQDPAAEEKADMEVLSTRPKGQISHDHFQRQQDAANRRVAAATAEVTQFRAELEKLRTATTKPPEDYEPTKKQLAEVREKLARVAFEQTDEFKERFTDRETRLRTLAETAAKDAGIDPKVIAHAMATTGKQRFEILENAGELSPGALSYISNVLAQHDDLTAERATVLSQSKERMAAWQQQQQARDAQQAEQHKAIEAQAFDEALKELSAEHIPYKQMNGNEKWAKEREERITRAKALFNDSTVTEKDLAKFALRAVGSETQDKIISALQTRLNAANAKVAELTAAGPSVNGNGQSRPGGADFSQMTDDERSMWQYEESARTAGRSM